MSTQEMLHLCSVCVGGGGGESNSNENNPQKTFSQFCFKGAFARLWVRLSELHK